MLSHFKYNYIIIHTYCFVILHCSLIDHLSDTNLIKRVTEIISGLWVAEYFFLIFDQSIQLKIVLS